METCVGTKQHKHGYLFVYFVYRMAVFEHTLCALVKLFGWILARCYAFVS